MALSRRTGARFQASIWPGFVDAMTGLLLVLTFVLSIFMVIQFVLSETITGQEDAIASQEDTIARQENRLDALSAEVAALARALGLSERENEALTDRLGTLEANISDNETRLSEQSALIDRLRAVRDEQATALSAAEARIASFEEQVASLVAERDSARAEVSDLRATQEELEASREMLISERDALDIALAQARTEMDAQAEAARLAAARRDALEALVADLRSRNADQAARIGTLGAEVDTLTEALSEEEAQRLAEAEAAAALRARLEDADAELTAMTMALEAERARAEETLTLLAASREAEADLNARLAAALVAEEEAVAETEALRETQDTLAAALAQAEADQEDMRALEERLAAALAARVRVEASAEETRERLAAALAAQRAAEADAAARLEEAERRALLLAEARDALDASEERASEAVLQTELLNQQVAALRTQIGDLQAILGEARARDEAAQVQLQALGSELNAALARAAAEERRRRQLEEAERLRLEEEAQELARYRSEFFGRMREILAEAEGVRIVGDRFVFSSEVLFGLGSAELSPAGQAELDGIAEILRGISGEIPEGIDWIIRVDGHTDDTPIRGGARFADNWELSQARALSVVRYFIDEHGVPPTRLAANGFGEYQPLNAGNTAEARAQNRRIELKLTER
jgi:chemotaxis protein MotB